MTEEISFEFSEHVFYCDVAVSSGLLHANSHVNLNDSFFIEILNLAKRADLALI